MRKTFPFACVMAAFAAAPALAGEVRHVQPSFHPGQAEAILDDGAGSKRLALDKSGGEEMRSPILVHLTASIDDRGQPRIRCDSGPALNFQASAMATRRPLAEPRQ